jgi:hypothetical protein
MTLQYVGGSRAYAVRAGGRTDHLRFTKASGRIAPITMGSSQKSSKLAGISLFRQRTSLRKI